MHLVVVVVAVVVAVTRHLEEAHLDRHPILLPARQLALAYLVRTQLPTPGVLLELQLVGYLGLNLQHLDLDLLRVSDVQCLVHAAVLNTCC